MLQNQQNGEGGGGGLLKNRAASEGGCSNFKLRVSISSSFPLPPPPQPLVILNELSLISGFLAFLEGKVLGKVLMSMPVCLISLDYQIIVHNNKKSESESESVSGLDS